MKNLRVGRKIEENGSFSTAETILQNRQRTARETPRENTVSAGAGSPHLKPEQ
jgi:hypothetical protein